MLGIDINSDVTILKSDFTCKTRILFKMTFWKEYVILGCTYQPPLPTKPLQNQGGGEEKS